MSINRAILVGNVGGDPELRRLNSGEPVATFSMATSDTWRDKATGERREATEWHTVVCFNPHIAKIIEQYVRKGSKVGVEGKIKTRKWEDRDGVKRYKTEIEIGQFDGKLSLESSPPGERTDDRGYGETRDKPSTARASTKPNADLDDDIPF